MSEFEHYCNTMRVERMRASVRVGEPCSACGQVVLVVNDRYPEDGPGVPYCIICKQKIVDQDLAARTVESIAGGVRCES